MRRLTIALALSLFVTLGYSQDSTETRKPRLPIWTFHTRNTNIYGIAVGLATVRSKPKKNVNTVGVRIELIGIGLALGLIPESPIAKDEIEFKKYFDEPMSEKVNGMALSPLGSICDCSVNGVTIDGFGHYYFENNGISIAGLMNLTQIVNGYQFSIVYNFSYRTNGLQTALFNFSKESNGIQMGIVNSTEKLRGLQLGLWNVNSKRKLPLINWSFKE